MKALVYDGPRIVRIQDAPDPKIEKPTDALVKITMTNICGSDLHMYEGRTTVEKGKVLGHENLGQVIEVGPAVERVKVGDGCVCRSILPAGSARIASAALPASALQPILDPQVPLTVMRRWARMTADKRSTCASPSPISILWSCPVTPSRNRQIT